MIQIGERSDSCLLFIVLLTLIVNKECLFIAIGVPTNNNLLIDLNHYELRKRVTKCVRCLY